MNNEEKNQEGLNNTIETIDNLVTPSEELADTPSPEPVLQPTQDALRTPIREGIGLDPSTLGTIGEVPENPQNLQANSNILEQETKKQVGTTPPKKEKKAPKMSKGIFTLLIIALIAGVGYGVFFTLTKLKEDKLTVTPNNLTFNLGEELPTDLKEYATFDGINPNNCTLNVKSVDTNKEGTYQYSILCDKKTYNGQIVVEDKIGVEAVLKTAYAAVGGEINPEDFIESCNKEKCEYAFVNKESVEEFLKEEGGPHEVVIKITSDSKEAEVKGNLVVTKEPIQFYLYCSSPTEQKESATYNIVDKFGLNNTGKYLGYATRNFEYTFKSEEAYKAVKEENDKKSEYDGHVGKLIFNDQEKKLTVEVKLIGETLNLEYNQGAFPDEFKSIETYYEGKQYSCETKRAQ